jgi:hypothetical protein
VRELGAHPRSMLAQSGSHTQMCTGTNWQAHATQASGHALVHARARADITGCGCTGIAALKRAHTRRAQVRTSARCRRRSQRRWQRWKRRPVRSGGRWGSWRSRRRADMATRRHLRRSARAMRARAHTRTRIHA